MTPSTPPQSDIRRANPNLWWKGHSVRDTPTPLLLQVLGVGPFLDEPDFILRRRMISIALLLGMDRIGNRTKCGIWQRGTRFLPGLAPVLRGGLCRCNTHPSVFVWAPSRSCFGLLFFLPGLKLHNDFQLSLDF